MTTDPYTRYDAAYVLGALSPAERNEYVTHLNSCAACASSVGELLELPALLATVSVEEFVSEPEAPPETLLPWLAREVRAERGRRRLRMGAAAAAAACLVAVGAVGGGALTGPDSRDRPPVASSPPARSGTANLALTAVVPSPVTASARLVDMAWGTRIDLTCAYAPKKLNASKGIPYAMVIIDRSGATQQVATWKALPDRELSVMGATALTRQDIKAVEIRTLSGRAILRLST